ncbi:prolipoprotein diacylglyceryl transferase [Naasia lichenicola]|uniref:Phosphatidylglycerol--prolipoprotein diacylglyceryl transferase n=1 Tax=Naasia lichenicola TaxID=2565933 RepID=A0A4S4FRS5_9MICO|nr:prolipoprotein diacylglyceryl transferase [Naasia lichenicola]THG33074.1 prolipoprotein diacylglyceryl transferase [Naasia lichenicola]
MSGLVGSSLVAPLSIPSPPSEWVTYVIPVGGLTFTIHAYALIILVGIIAAIVLTSRRLTARGAEPGIVIDIALWAVPLGIIGARLYHVFTHVSDYFVAGKSPLDTFIGVIAIWEGGNAIFGSLIGGAIGVLIGCRISGLRFWTFADALAPGLLIAQALGRLGNWFNVELYGIPTDLPWGLEVPSSNSAFPAGLADGTLFHPTFLYELIWNLIGAALLIVLGRRASLQWGKTLALYLIWYGIGRSAIESIRIDTSEVFLGIRTNVWAGFAAILIGVVIFVVQSRRHPGLEPSPYRPGREWAGDRKPVGSSYTASDFEDGAGPDTTDAAPREAATSGAARSK